MTATFLLGHLGIGLGLAWLLAWRSPARVDYRLILFGAILPDLIDKPLGYALGLQTRLWGHTLLFLFTVLALGLVPAWRGSRFAGFGVATHLLLDQMWELPHVVWYPAYGWGFPATPFSADVWFEALLHDPYVQAGEIVGFAILVAFAWVHGIRSWSAVRAFVGHGTLPPRASGRDETNGDSHR
ncbi:MAG TPA: metal-dependent hydrolase [Thermoplasmata archaeon]